MDEDGAPSFGPGGGGQDISGYLETSVLVGINKNSTCSEPEDNDPLVDSQPSSLDLSADQSAGLVFSADQSESADLFDDQSANMKTYADQSEGILPITADQSQGKKAGSRRSWGKSCKRKNCPHCLTPNCGECVNCLKPANKSKCIKRNVFILKGPGTYLYCQHARQDEGC